jgi:hypothetical protein
MDYTTVSAKIPREIKHKIEEYGIKPSEVIRKAIQNEIKKFEIMNLKKESELLKPIINKIKSEQVAKSIREDRER